jgi:hypothetical protein
MVMLTAYLDESGTHAEASSMVLAGYVATVDQWSEFYREWTALLKAENVHVLHRTDIESFHGEFKRSKGWDDTRKLRVLRAAHEIIKKWTEIGRAVAVIQADFDGVMLGVIKRAFGGAYGFLAGQYIVEISKWARDTNQPGPIQYVFEAGAKGRRQVDRMCSLMFEKPPRGIIRQRDWREVMRFGGWSFQRKECVRQLQAADFIAYEAYKHMDNRIVGVPGFPAKGFPKAKVRDSALDLFRPNDLIEYFDRQRLRTWINENAKVVRSFEEWEKGLRAMGRKDLI